MWCVLFGCLPKPIRMNYSLYSISPEYSCVCVCVCAYIFISVQRRSFTTKILILFSKVSFFRHPVLPFLSLCLHPLFPSPCPASLTAASAAVCFSVLNIEERGGAERSSFGWHPHRRHSAAGGEACFCFPLRNATCHL